MTASSSADGRASALDLASGLPESVREEAAAVLRRIPSGQLDAQGVFSVLLAGERLDIPQRIYNEELSAHAVTAFSTSEQMILHCLYSRHHDGFVRQRHLESVIESPLPWVVPYVVALIGEYVIEILVTIQDRLDLVAPDSPDRRRYGRFVIENPEFFERVTRRVTSYWNCYYRFDFPVARPRDGRFATYPGFQLIDELRIAAADSLTGVP